MPETFDLKNTYVHLAGTEAETIPVTEAFWPEVIAGKRTLEGWLVTVFPQTADWPTWEIHPAGHEILTLLSGAIELVLAEPTGPRSVAMVAGSTLVVPPGTWHTAKVKEAGELLAITAGQGTQHAPGPPDPAAG